MATSRWKMLWVVLAIGGAWLVVRLSLEAFYPFNPWVIHNEPWRVLLEVEFYYLVSAAYYYAGSTDPADWLMTVEVAILEGTVLVGIGLAVWGIVRRVRRRTGVEKAGE